MPENFKVMKHVKQKVSEDALQGENPAESSSVADST